MLPQIPINSPTLSLFQILEGKSKQDLHTILVIAFGRLKKSSIFKKVQAEKNL